MLYPTETQRAVDKHILHNVCDADAVTFGNNEGLPLRENSSAKSFVKWARKREGQSAVTCPGILRRTLRPPAVQKDKESRTVGRGG